MVQDGTGRLNSILSRCGQSHAPLPFREIVLGRGAHFPKQGTGAGHAPSPHRPAVPPLGSR
jgi:hypothetical protein